MRKRKQIELILLFLYFLFAGVLLYNLKWSFLLSTIIYMGLPAIYISFRLPKYSRKCLIESSALSIPIVLTIDYIAHVSNAWYEYSSEIGIRVLDSFPIETFVWGFVYIYLIIISYEFFFDRSKINKMPRKFRKEILVLSLILFFFLAVLFLNNQLLIINNFYTYLSIGFLLFVLIGFYKHPKLFNKIIITEIYFFLPWIIHEIFSLESKHWIFRGTYLGSIQIFNYSFPLEEFWWLIIVVPAVLLWHEHFADDCR